LTNIATLRPPALSGWAEFSALQAAFFGVGLEGGDDVQLRSAPLWIVHRRRRKITFRSADEVSVTSSPRLDVERPKHSHAGVVESDVLCFEECLYRQIDELGILGGLLLVRLAGECGPAHLREAGARILDMCIPGSRMRDAREGV
jgi:hypothetical protein